MDNKKFTSTQIGFCRRGGQDGIVPTPAEQRRINNYFQSKFSDQYMPLPGRSPEEQRVQNEACKAEGLHENMSTGTYWEDKTGAHGWCCRKCGEVLQWG